MKPETGLYLGSVSHSRLTPVRHSFRYPFALMLLDLDDLPRLSSLSGLFGESPWSALRFRQQDYLKAAAESNTASSLKQRVLDKVIALGGEAGCDSVLFAGQLRHFGLYFSPVNFFYCFQGDEYKYLLAEVSNTPGMSVTVIWCRPRRRRLATSASMYRLLCRWTIAIAGIFRRRQSGSICGSAICPARGTWQGRPPSRKRPASMRY